LKETGSKRKDEGETEVNPDEINAKGEKNKETGA
jgi:hypothetical protein